MPLLAPFYNVNGAIEIVLCRTNLELNKGEFSSKWLICPVGERANNVVVGILLLLQPLKIP